MKAGRLWKIFVLAVLVVAAGAPVPAWAADTYKIDPVHSSVVFKIKHLDITYVYGRFNNAAGTLTIDEKNPANSAVAVTVNAADVDTANEKRDAHLRSPDFFNAEKYGTISFTSRKFEKVGENTYTVSGDLTLLGVTRPLTASVRHTGSGNDPWGGYRTGYETSFSIKRSDFGMTYLLEGVADDVTIHVSVEAVRQ
jgi:polyisoprenoid-binding protein YceI